MAGGQLIVAFYEGAAPDDRGRYLDDVLKFDDGALERTHDFIQWLFPLRERSGANPSAPQLDDATVAAFRERPELRSAMRRSFERMRAFYTASDHWLVPGDHNHLRITRMMISMKTLGLEDEARSFFAWLMEIAGDRPEAVSASTLRYWKDALR